MSSPTRQLVDGERHRLVALASFGAVVLPPEGHAAIVEGDEAAVDQTQPSSQHVI
jgi:hypothetical protein